MVILLNYQIRTQTVRVEVYLRVCPFNSRKEKLEQVNLSTEA